MTPLSLALLVVAFTADAWVYLDAKRRSETGDQVIATVGPVTLSSPEQWLLGSLVLWVFVVPLYLAARRG